MQLLDMHGNVWQKTHCRFMPSGKREDLERYYNNPRGSVIVVPSLQKGLDWSNDYEYRFEGVQTFDEFIKAVSYVMSVDFKKSGLMSRLARDYIPVYRHAQLAVVERYLRRGRFF